MASSTASGTKALNNDEADSSADEAAASTVSVTRARLIPNFFSILSTGIDSQINHYYWYFGILVWVIPQTHHDWVFLAAFSDRPIIIFGEFSDDLPYNLTDTVIKNTKDFIDIINRKFDLQTLEDIREGIEVAIEKKIINTSRK